MRRKVFQTLLFLLAGCLGVSASDQWVVHEWATFTSLQDESGATIGGINTDDEPLPKFVHRLSDWILLLPSEIPLNIFQGAPHCHPEVTMRLETPVIYFHPPKDWKSEHTINIGVKFQGGWLSEFYPQAEANAPGLIGKGFGWNGAHLRPATVSSLNWTNLVIGNGRAGSNTSYHVWNAPRQVEAANVDAGGEAEKFLFYRGVAHIDAPLKVSRESGQLKFHSQLDPVFLARGGLKVSAMWLVDIQSDGKLAFRALPAITLKADNSKVLLATGDSFGAADYSVGNLTSLRTELKRSLLKEGLFDDEANALLNTWELSYFKSAGMRVFFMVPRAWTDHYLPLDISESAQVNRAMVGRIELITPKQRVILHQLGNAPVEKIKGEAKELREKFYANYSPDSFERMSHGRETLAEAKVEVPETYRLYLSLGRFRNTLVLDEASRQPDSDMKEFVQDYGLFGYQLKEPLK